VWRDYWELCKPRVVALMLLTAWVGMLLALPPFALFPWLTFLWGTLGIAFAAGSAAVINHLADRHIDIQMDRTHYRQRFEARLAPFDQTLSTGIYLIDPQGYLMMHYSEETAPRDILKDLKRLLRVNRT